MKSDNISHLSVQFSCPDYTASESDGRRCRNYVDGGGCELDSYVMCVEWLRLNPDTGGAPGVVGIASSGGVAATATVDTEGAASSRVPREPEKLSTPCAEAVDAGGAVSGIGLVTESSLRALAATGAEVDLKLGDGALVTLVPGYTGASRQEISYRDCATIIECIRVFPGAKFESFRGSRGGES
jgi:hypothetical protein